MVKVPRKSSITKERALSWDPRRSLQEEKIQREMLQLWEARSQVFDCRLSKRNKPKEANVVDSITKDVFDIDLTTIISEVNLVGSNPRNGGLTLVLLAICVLTTRCSLPLNQLRLEKRCSWGTLPHWISKGKVRWF